jgi:hypothetical protein
VTLAAKRIVTIITAADVTSPIILTRETNNGEEIFMASRTEDIF